MFDGLSISITGSGASAKSAVRGVRESLQDARSAALGLAGGMNAAGESMDETASDAAGLTLAMRGLRGQTDEAGDEMLEAAGKAGVASGAFTTLSAGSEGLSLSFHSLSLTTQLSLIPSLLTLATVLAPLAAAFTAVVAGAGSLAVTFGSLVGSGILSWGEQLADQIDGVSSPMEALSKVVGRLRRRLADALAPLGEAFVPLLQQATLALPSVVEEMVAAVGGTDEFRVALRQFGGVAADVLPSVTGFVFDLARKSIPVARDFFGFLRSNGRDAFRAIMASVRELAPEWNAFLNALVEMSPVLLEFGTNAAEVVVPALTGLITAATGFMETINGLTPEVRSLTIAVLALAPAITTAVTALSGLSVALGGSGLLGVLSGSGGVLAALGSGGLAGALAALTGPVGIAIAAIAGLAIAWETNLGNMRSWTRDTVSFIRSEFQKLPSGARGAGPGDPGTSFTEQVMGDVAPTERETTEENQWGGDTRLQQVADATRSPPGGVSTEEIAGSWLDPSTFESEGEAAGEAAARGIQSGLQGVTIRSRGLTPAIREALKSGVSGYVSDPSEFEDKPTKITEDLFRRVAEQSGASAETLGVSQQEFEILRARYGRGSVSSAGSSAMPSSPSSGMPSTSLSDSLQPIVDTFDSAVDRFAQAIDNMEVVVTVADGEFAQAVDARIQQQGQQTARQAENTGVWTR